MSNQNFISRFRPGFIPLLSFFACLFFLIGVGPGSTRALAAQVTLSWNANADSRVAGYKLYYGKASRSYGTQVDVGKVTRYTLSGIEEGKNCYFAITAYDANRKESEFSAELECFTLVPAAGANGSISPGSAVVVSRATSQAFKVTPATGYSVKDVLVDGVSVGAVYQFMFPNITASHSIAASFSPGIIINATAGPGGKITPSGSTVVQHGRSLTISLTPNSGYLIKDVQVDGVSIGKVNSYTFSNVTSGHSISAIFASSFLEHPDISVYAIYASAGANGSISPSGNVLVQKGASKEFAIKPNTKYQVADVLVNGTSVGAVKSYTFSDVQGNHSISATFKPSGEVSSYLLAGSGALPGNGGWIEVLNSQDGQAVPPVHIDWPDYNKLSGEMRIATGDINGDGRDEIVVGLGRVKEAPGIPRGYFAVLGADFSIIAWGQMKWPEYNEMNGETRPACGDIDGDGIDEIIIGLGPGGQGRMAVFKFVDNRPKHIKWLQTGWFEYNEINGETRPACGDLDGDGRDEIIAGLGPANGNPDIPGGVFFIFDQTSAGSADLQDSGQSDASGWGVTSWPDYNFRINGEIWPACGDVNGDGRDEIVLGLGKQGAGWFEIMGFDLLQNRTQHIAWQRSLLSIGAEVRPACGSLESDAGDEIVIGFSKGGVGIMEVFGNAAQNFQPLKQVQTQLNPFQKQESQIWPAVFRLKVQ